MRAVLKAFCVVLCLSAAAYADDDDDGGDSDTSETVTSSGPEPEQPCDSAQPCKKLPRVDFEAWDKSRKALDEAGKERPGNSNVRP